ncbi:MAG: MltA domain-containing protein [Alphaproteobacteria bacterium]|nr:MltA domain-containing protein [Alphaproteobacteria bacterium]
MPKKLFISISLLIVLGVLGFFLFKSYFTFEPEIKTEKIAFKELPGWQKDNIKEALPALQNNCAALEKLPAEYKLATDYIDFGTPADWQGFCNKIKDFKGENKDLYRLLAEETVPYKLITKDKKKGVFTGYYEAELKGSNEKTEKYNVPVYGRPYDMVQIDLRDFGIEADKPKFFAMVKDGKVVPYVSRKEFEKAPNAPVLVWVDSVVDLFIMQIQGSGRVQTENGEHIKIGYAANNEHPFVGIGSLMMKNGLLEKGKSSMPEIKDWLLKNPEKARELMAENPRYIFFKINESEGPFGALGVPLTPKRSLAVDTNYIALGVPLWLDTVDADGNKIQQLMTAQDIGKAIKGKIRGDFFWGFGEEAFLQAGRMKSAGEYFVLLPKAKAED